MYSTSLINQIIVKSNNIIVAEAKLSSVNQQSKMSTVGPAPGSGYFVDQKKGEVNELKQVLKLFCIYDHVTIIRTAQLLKNINVERDMNRKRDIIKKVIAYMTLGIDVSRLFTDMIMVSKKLLRG
jgi:hypothetical protein